MATKKAPAAKKITKKTIRRELIGIAKLAKLSISTLVKWHEETLAVKPATELRIFDATNKFYE